MATLTLTSFTGALEGVADTDYRLVAAGARVSSPWNIASPTGKALLWRCNAPSWNGTPGEVIDSSGNGNTGRAISGAQTASGALDRYGDCVLNSSIRGDTGLNWFQQYTLECWLYANTGIANGREYINATFTNLSLRHFNTTAIYRAFGVDRAFTLPRNQWLYLTLQAAPGGSCEVYINGVNVVSSTAGAGSAGTNILAVGASNTGANPQTCAVDEMQVTLGTKVRTGNFAAPTMMSSASIRPSATVVDSGSAGSTWSQLVTTIAAVTSDETYAVYVYPSESATVPTASSGLWQLIGSGYTTGQTLAISGTGRYCHTKIVTGASTGIGQYAVELDGLQWTYSLSSSSGIRRYNPHYLIGRNPGVM